MYKLDTSDRSRTVPGLKKTQFTSKKPKLHFPLVVFRYVGTLNLLRWGQHRIDWDDMKSHGSPHIGEHFGDKMVGCWWGLRWFKNVLVAMLGPSS